jgi:hypothetical protein
MDLNSTIHLALVSDIHYGGAAEAKRRHVLLAGITNPLRRRAVHLYRYYVWLRDPFAHNHLLDEFIRRSADADLVVANGDYSCDSAYIGVVDDAAFHSAWECLDKLRQKFPTNFQATIGDHELGKKMLGADVGGLRVASYHRAEKELALRPFWQVNLGQYVLLGLVSSLIALPVYQAEAIPDEMAAWDQLRQQHLDEIRRAFAALRSDQKVLLFCHDPTALPFLWREKVVRDKLPQVERTIIGHLHSPIYLTQSRVLSGMPVIRFLGHTVLRVSSALREARLWRPFRVLLCPSPAGSELLKDGGFYSVELDPSARQPARFTFHPLPR